MKKLVLTYPFILATLLFCILSCQESELPTPEKNHNERFVLKTPTDNQNPEIVSRTSNCDECQIELPTTGLGTNISDIEDATYVLNTWAEDCFEKNCFPSWAYEDTYYEACAIYDVTGNVLLGGILSPEELIWIMGEIGCIVEENRPNSAYLVRDIQIVVWDALPIPARCMSVYILYNTCGPR